MEYKKIQRELTILNTSLINFEINDFDVKCKDNFLTELNEISVTNFYNFFVGAILTEIKNLYNPIEEKIEKFMDKDLVIYLGTKDEIKEYKKTPLNCRPSLNFGSIYKQNSENEMHKFIFTYHILRCCFFTLSDEYDMMSKQILVSKINIYEKILNTDSITVIRSLYNENSEVPEMPDISNIINEKNLSYTLGMINKVVKDPSKYGVEGLGLESLLGAI